MADSSKRTVLTRREALILSATAGVGIAAGKQALASDSIKTAAHQGPGNCSTPSSAVAKTQYGKVRGYVDGGVFTFKGVPYGATTAGENRWLPAKPPSPWTDEYFALVYGANCPQNLHTWTSPEQTFIQDWDDGWQSEDMLKLNIWTPSLTGKRPVMFYMHGGGFSFGSSYELPSHEGAQMARHHDVVQVSVNHRLNVLGFFDVSEHERAKVKKVERVRADNHTKQRAFIEFPLMSGSIREAHVDFQRQPPQAGSAIVIIYDRENPDRVMRYPVAMMRITRVA